MFTLTYQELESIINHFEFDKKNTTIDVGTFRLFEQIIISDNNRKVIIRMDILDGSDCLPPKRVIYFYNNKNKHKCITIGFDEYLKRLETSIGEKTCLVK